jgi:hypothetical protein
MDSMNNNPYTPPESNVADVPTYGDGTFIQQGRSVPFINGAKWIDQSIKMVFQQPKTWFIVIAIYVAISLFTDYIVEYNAMLVMPVSIAVVVIEMMLFAGIMFVAESHRRTGHADLSLLSSGFTSRTGGIIGVLLIQLGIIILAVLVLIVTFTASAMPQMEQLTFAAEAGNFNRVTELLMSIGPGKIIFSILLFLTIIIFSQMLTCFAIPLMVLHQLTLGESLSASFSGSRKNILPALTYFTSMIIVLFIYGFASAFIPVLETISSFLGALIMVPTWYLAIYLAYRNIFTNSESVN